MSKNYKRTETSIPSEKNFGIVFSIVFMVISLYPLVNDEGVNLWYFIIATILFVIAYVSPKILSVPNLLWFKFGEVLGAVVAPIVIGIVYFATVVPIGIIMKLVGKDLVKKNFDKRLDSYWLKRSQNIGSMKDQF